MYLFGIGGLLERPLFDSLWDQISFEERPVECPTPLKRVEAYGALRDAVDTQQPGASQQRTNRIRRLKIETDVLEIGCGKFWGPVFYGQLEPRDGGGTTLRGYFDHGRGAKVALGAPAIGLLTLVVMVLFGFWQPSSILVWTVLSTILYFVAGFCIAGHKKSTVDEVERQICAALQGLDYPAEEAG